MTLLRKIIEIHHEQALRRKALRILVKQDWSFDFLVHMLARASREAGHELVLEVHNRGGQYVVLRSGASLSSVPDDADDIFNRLDDEAAVESFIREHSTR